MIDLRSLEAVQQLQKQQDIQNSPLANKAMERAAIQQSSYQIPEEFQGIIDNINAEREQRLIQDRMNVFNNYVQQMACGGCISHGSGGSIHIDPSKKGTFTAAASRHGMGVQAFASKVLAHKENYSPAMVKKANFARNASKFHHAFGGPLNSYGEGDVITISQLPREFVDAHGAMLVRTPSGNAVPLNEAYSKWGGTHVNVNDVPGLTDYLLTQPQIEAATTGEVQRAAQHRANQEFNRQVDNFFMGNWVMPHQIFGAFNPYGDNSNTSFGERLFLGSGNTGLVSHRFAQDHPYLTTATNLLFDMATPLALKPFYSPASASISTGSVQNKPINIGSVAEIGSSTYQPSRIFTDMDSFFANPESFNTYKTKIADLFDNIGVPSGKIRSASSIEEMMNNMRGSALGITPEQVQVVNEAIKNARLQRKYYYIDAMTEKLVKYINEHGDPAKAGNRRIENRYINGGRDRLQTAANEAYKEFLDSGAAKELDKAFKQARYTAGTPMFNNELLKEISIYDADRLQHGKPLLESGLVTDYKPINIVSNAGEALDGTHYTFTIDSSAGTMHRTLPQSAVENFVEDSKLGLSQAPLSFEGETFINPRQIEELVPENGDLFAALEDAASHEPAHLMMPTTYSSPKGFNLTALSDYLTHHGYTELAARGSQIKNYLERLGIWKEGDQITGEMLKRAANEYPKKVMDNNMTDMFNAITNWDDAAKWFTEFAPATAGVAVGGGLVSNEYSKGGYIEDGLRARGVTGFRVTSGYRGPNSKVGHAGKRSGHARYLSDGRSSGAIDIVPTDKSPEGWARLEQQLRRPEVEEFIKGEIGGTILAETDPATMKKTGATGPHYHIGLGVAGDGNFYGHNHSTVPRSASSRASGPSMSAIPFGLPEPMMAMTPIQEEPVQPEAPWWGSYLSTPQQAASSVIASPFGEDYSFLDLAWNPMTGSNESTTTPSSFPNLFAEGGPVNVYRSKGRMTRSKAKPLKVGETLAGSRADTDQCAKFANDYVRSQGYMQNGDAWNSSGISTVFSGYDGLERPSAYDAAAVAAYNNAASDNVLKNFDSSTLDPERLYTVNMYFRGSPYQEEAFNNGTKDRTGTHTGYLQNQDGQWYVVHNIHGKVHIDPFSSIQGGGRGWGVTGIYAPRKDNIWNRGITKLGFADGGDLNQTPQWVAPVGLEIMPPQAVDMFGTWNEPDDLIQPMDDIGYNTVASQVYDKARKLAYSRFISGSWVPGLGGQPKRLALPDKVKGIIQNDVLGRLEAAYNNEGLSLANEPKLVSAYNKVRYSVYPQSYYEAAGHPTWGGFTSPFNKSFISVREDNKNRYWWKTLPHEVRHTLQNNGLVLTPRQQTVLDNAYDDVFTSMDFGRTDMDFEKETTNLDARIRFFHNLGRQDLVGKGPSKQNAYLRKASWQSILKAVEESNGYGQRYIRELRKRYKNNPDELRKHAERFRQSMMYVAMADDPQVPMDDQPSFA